MSIPAEMPAEVTTSPSSTGVAGGSRDVPRQRSQRRAGSGHARRLGGGVRRRGRADPDVSEVPWSVDNRLPEGSHYRIRATATDAPMFGPPGGQLAAVVLSH